MDQKKQLEKYISDLLKEMQINIKKAFNKNIEKKKHDIFKCFHDENILKYMTVSRSFDSQLGTKLEQIAFHISKMKYGENNVPNYVLLTEGKEKMKIDTITFSLSEKQYTQKLVWLNKGEEVKVHLTADQKKCLKNKKYEKNSFYVECPSNIEQIKKVFMKEDGTLKDIPVDLVVINEEKIMLFEIKAGGNLDTKNSKSNIAEINDFKKIGKIFKNPEVYFATCYNNKGEGNQPEGAIFSKLPKENVLVGSEFWNRILPDEITYDEFIEIYRRVFKQKDFDGFVKNL